MFEISDIYGKQEFEKDGYINYVEVRRGLIKNDVNATISIIKNETKKMIDEMYGLENVKLRFFIVELIYKKEEK